LARSSLFPRSQIFHNTPRFPGERRMFPLLALYPLLPLTFALAPTFLDIPSLLLGFSKDSGSSPSGWVGEAEVYSLPPPFRVVSRLCSLSCKLPSSPLCISDVPPSFLSDLDFHLGLLDTVLFGYDGRPRFALRALLGYFVEFPFPNSL